MSSKRNALSTAAKRVRGGVFAAAVLTPLLAFADMPAYAPVTSERLVNAQPGRRDPGFIHYCTGPDGTRFDNRSIVTLRDVLRRKYGRGVRITETWKTA